MKQPDRLESASSYGSTARRESASSYGSTDPSSSAHPAVTFSTDDNSSVPQEPRVRRRDNRHFTETAFGWEYRGGLRHLSVEFLMTVGKQFVALSLVLVQIYRSENLMMSCDTRKAEITMIIGVMCEYTKAYTRCFPLLAVVVSLIVASRMMLCQRMYYKMLKKGAVLDYKDVFPGNDSLFLLLAWSAVNAFSHFVMELSMEHPLNAETVRKLMQSEPVLQARIHEVASLYVFPSIVFMAFLWTAYDVETRLLPLTKYFGEDPQRARQLLSSVKFLDESVAACIVKQHEIEFVDTDGRELTTDEVFTRFVTRCHYFRPAVVYVLEGSPSKGKRRVTGDQKEFAALLEGDDALQQFSYVHLISEMWPGRLLLDHRLQDQDSANFRLYWLGCSAAAILTMIVILGLLIEQLWADIGDVREGQKADIVAIGVELKMEYFYNRCSS